MLHLFDKMFEKEINETKLTASEFLEAYINLMKTQLKPLHSTWNYVDILVDAITESTHSDIAQIVLETLTKNFLQNPTWFTWKKQEQAYANSDPEIEWHVTPMLQQFDEPQQKMREVSQKANTQIVTFNLSLQTTEVPHGLIVRCVKAKKTPSQNVSREKTFDIIQNDQQIQLVGNAIFVVYKTSEGNYVTLKQVHKGKWKCRVGFQEFTVVYDDFYDHKEIRGLTIYPHLILYAFAENCISISEAQNKNLEFQITQQKLSYLVSDVEINYDSQKSVCEQYYTLLFRDVFDAKPYSSNKHKFEIKHEQNKTTIFYHADNMEKIPITKITHLIDDPP